MGGRDQWVSTLHGGFGAVTEKKTGSPRTSSPAAFKPVLRVPRGAQRRVLSGPPREVDRGELLPSMAPPPPAELDWDVDFDAPPAPPPFDFGIAPPAPAESVSTISLIPEPLSLSEIETVDPGAPELKSPFAVPPLFALSSDVSGIAVVPTAALFEPGPAPASSAKRRWAPLAAAMVLTGAVSWGLVHAKGHHES